MQKCLMRPRSVVEAHELGDEAPDVLIAQDEDVIEQLSNNRIIRPESEWIGPNNVPYVPIGERA